MHDLVPPWLETFRVAEQTLATAYEATRPEHRAWIKTTLALVRARYPHVPGQMRQVWSQHDLGFRHHVQVAPAPWVVCVLASGFASAVRLAAALMVARLAGVPEIIVVRTAVEADVPFAPALLTAMELAGIEQVFSIPPECTVALLAEWSQHHGQGRVLVHHTHADAAETAFFTGLAQCASEHRLPVWHDQPPTLGVSVPDADMALLSWAHPDARIVQVTSDASPGSLLRLDAIYEAGPDDNATADVTPLRLCGHGPDALTGAWLHTDLEPTFFQTRVYGARFALPNANDA